MSQNIMKMMSAKFYFAFMPLLITPVNGETDYS